MLQLPKDIDEKIQKLPVISFGDSEAFQTVIFSEDFTDIFNYYKQNYLPDVLRVKPEIEQKISLYLSLTNQDESFVDQTDQILYRRPVPDIHTFLNDKFYMGYNNATLYNYWRDKLEMMFAKGSPIRKTIFDGCIGCLTGDTKVATLNGNKTMKELVINHENEWVLSFNTKNKEWEPDKIIDAFSTGIKDIYEITLDSGDIIRCTANHLFLTRQNKWKSIDTGLTPGMSMMPYYEQISKTGYIQVKNNTTEKFENRYSIVGKWKSRVCKGIAIHHKNIDKLDDRPENLCMLPYKIHTEYHQKKGGDRWREYNASIQGDEFKEYRSLKAKKSNETYKKNKDYKKLEKKRMKVWNELLHDSDRQSKIAKLTWEKYPEKMKKAAQAVITARNKTEKARNTSRKMAENMRNLIKNKTSEEIIIINLKRSLSSLERFHGITSDAYKKVLAKIHEKEPWYNPKLGAKANHKLKSKYNHKIISIKYIGKEEVFDLTTERNHNFALTSGIIAHNSGKSTVARKAFVYVLYRLLCLRYARATFNIDADSTIANIVISMTLKQVYDTNLLPFVKLMETMPCFQHVMSTRAFENFDLNNPKCPFPYAVEKSSGTVFFPDNIILTCGSNQGHFTGYNVVNSFCDEINEKGVEEALALLNTLDNRFASRFAGSDLVFQSVVSSARTTNSPIGEYVKRLPKDPSILHLKPMLWEVKPDPNFVGDGTTFPVLVGNGSVPSRIITNPGDLEALDKGDFYIPAGCLLINVPTVYRSKFELQLDQSIQDIAGISTYDNSMIFRDTSQLEDQLLVPELTIEANLKENTNIFNCLPLDMLFIKDGLKGEYRLKRYPTADRYMHFDLSSSGECDTGICMLHKEYKINEITREKETMYVIDFIIYVTAKNMTDLEAVQNFAMELITRGHIPIHTISCDQFQSQTTLNTWEQSGYFQKVEKVSVDIKLDPYLNAAALIEGGKVKIGKCDKLKKELETLIIDKGKVTRTTELKDGADVLCGAIYNAQMNYTDVPQNEYFSQIIIKNETDYNTFIDTEQEELVDL